MTDKSKNDFRFTSENVKKMVDDHNDAKNPFLDEFDRDQLRPLGTMEDLFFARTEKPHEGLTTNTRTVKTQTEDDYSYVFEGISPTEISAQLLRAMISSPDPRYYFNAQSEADKLRALHSVVTELMTKDRERK